MVSQGVFWASLWCFRSVVMVFSLCFMVFSECLMVSHGVFMVLSWRLMVFMVSSWYLHGVLMVFSCCHMVSESMHGLSKQMLSERETKGMQEREINGDKFVKKMNSAPLWL